MIVARITDQLRNRNPKTPGSCRLDGYESWFPLSDANFSFDFGGKKTSPDVKKLATATTEPEVRKLLAESNVNSSGKPQSSVSCSKLVDVASSALMYLSVFDKLCGRDGEKIATEPLAADIHFVEISGGSIKAASSSKSSVAVYMKIALEEVTVASWSMSGSSDDRPSESFTLKYEKIAIQYLQFDEAGNFMPTNAKGFDQQALESWIPGSWKGRKP